MISAMALAGEPLVSIVVPMYNAYDRIEIVITSIVRQSYPNIELILVDDGSGDETPGQLARVLAGQQIVWRLIRQENAGPSKARNVGWRAAKGELIQFLDDDDEIAEDKIMHQVQWLKNMGSDAALVYSTWAIRTAGLQCIVLRRPDCYEWRPEDVIRSECFLPFGSSLVRKEWLAAVGGFDERFRLIEDVDLQIRMLAAGARFAEAVSERPLFFYKQRSGSLSQSAPVAFVEGCLRNARLVWTIAKQRARLDENVNRTVADVYRQTIAFYAETDWRRFEEVYREYQVAFPGRPLQQGGAARHFVPLLGERGTELLRGSVRAVRKAPRAMAASIASMFGRDRGKFTN